VPELSSIRTLIDLELGKLFLESPKRKDKLQISVLENLTHLRAEVDVYGQRYDCGIVYMFALYEYDNIMTSFGKLLQVRGANLRRQGKLLVQ